MATGTFTADAAITSGQSGTFTVDAEIANRSFTIDAFILNSNAQRHHRIRDHYGADSDLNVVLSKNIGKYVAYTPVHWVLEDLLARIALLEDYDHVRSSFTVDAYITTNSIYIDAVIGSTSAGSFTVDAYIILGSSFTIDAVIMPSFTIDAFIV